MRVPLRQGDLDGLCGLYALVNAGVYLAVKVGKRLSPRELLELFQRLATTLCKRLNRRKRQSRGDVGGGSPIEFLWSGTSIMDLPPMLEELKSFLEEKAGAKLTRSQALLRNPKPKTLDQF